MSVESHITGIWRLRVERLRLVGSNCQSCGRVHFPLRRICPECSHDNTKPVILEDASIIEGDHQDILLNGSSGQIYTVKG
jgi:uncharacterized OB-fold protein